MIKLPGLKPGQGFFRKYNPLTIKFFEEIKVGDTVEFSIFDQTSSMLQFKISVDSKCKITAFEGDQLIIHGFDFISSQEVTVTLDEYSKPLKIIRTFEY